MASGRVLHRLAVIELDPDGAVPLVVRLENVAARAVAPARPEERKKSHRIGLLPGVESTPPTDSLAAPPIEPRPEHVARPAVDLERDPHSAVASSSAGRSVSARVHRRMPHLPGSGRNWTGEPGHNSVGIS